VVIKPGYKTVYTITKHPRKLNSIRPSSILYTECTLKAPLRLGTAGRGQIVRKQFHGRQTVKWTRKSGTPCIYLFLESRRWNARIAATVSESGRAAGIKLVIERK